jgi:hypothetical protein
MLSWLTQGSIQSFYTLDLHFMRDISTAPGLRLLMTQTQAPEDRKKADQSGGFGRSSSCSSFGLHLSLTTFPQMETNLLL